MTKHPITPAEAAAQGGIRNQSTGRVTKQGHALMVQRAQALLLAAGWNVTDSSSGIAIDVLVAEFGIQSRTARAIESQAARLLRGEVVEQWRSGRPRKWARVQIEKAREAGLIK